MPKDRPETARGDGSQPRAAAAALPPPRAPGSGKAGRTGAAALARQCRLPGGARGAQRAPQPRRGRAHRKPSAGGRWGSGRRRWSSPALRPLSCSGGEKASAAGSEEGPRHQERGRDGDKRARGEEEQLSNEEDALRGSPEKKPRSGSDQNESPGPGCRARPGSHFSSLK